MEKYIIFVEGKADATFIRDYLVFLNKNLAISKNNQKEKELQDTENFIRIIVAGGYTAIKKSLKTKFEEIQDFKYKILVIQDADNSNTDPNNGGTELRIKYLEEIKKELKVNFKIFLFPNNENDGDLETLLLKIVNREKFNPAFDCYKKYADCTKEIGSNEFSKELLEDKRLVFNYFRTYYGMEMAREEKRIFTTEYWRLTSKKLEPLKKFLNNIIKRNDE
ncbi:MAG: DUF3226 domain-containing protein [Bacteroidota bacterium]|nr:DUF3226 domain-containing protein [Bacteroidota bacterium]